MSSEIDRLKSWDAKTDWSRIPELSAFLSTGFSKRTDAERLKAKISDRAGQAFMQLEVLKSYLDGARHFHVVATTSKPSSSFEKDGLASAPAKLRRGSSPAKRLLVHPTISLNDRKVDDPRKIEETFTKNTMAANQAQKGESQKPPAAPGTSPPKVEISDDKSLQHYMMPDTESPPPEVGICKAVKEEGSLKTFFKSLVLKLKLCENEHHFPLYVIAQGHSFGSSKQDNNCAQLAAELLPKHLKSKMESEWQNSPSQNKDVPIFNALKATFVAVSRLINGLYPKEEFGATATVAMLIGHELWVAWVGPARAILVQKEQKPIRLNSENVVPNKNRGENFKNSDDPLIPQRVLGMPEIGSGKNPRCKIVRICLNEIPGEPDGNPLLVIASSGICEALSTMEISDCVKEVIQKPCSAIANAISLKAFEASGKDNTSIVVRLSKQKCPEEFSFTLHSRQTASRPLKQKVNSALPKQYGSLSLSALRTKRSFD